MIKNPCIVVHFRSINELLIAAQDKLTQIIELTFILAGYFPSAQELSYRPCQNVLWQKQSTNEQWKAIFDKQPQWIPNTSPNPTFCFTRLWALDIRMNGDPCA